MSYTDVPEDVRAVLESVAEERNRQRAIWGTQRLPNGTEASLSNISARDSFRKIAEWNHKQGKLSWYHVAHEEELEARAEEDLDALEDELTQCAAVYCAWIEDVRRQKADRDSDRDDTEGAA